MKHFDWIIFYGTYGNGLFWLRISKLKYGIHIKDTSINWVPFSERMGIRKVLRIGKWSIKLLNKF